MVTDHLPFVLRYASNDCGVTIVDTLVTWEVGDRQMNQTEPCKLITTIRLAAFVDLVNHASASSDRTADDSSDNVASATVRKQGTNAKPLWRNAESHARTEL